MTSLRWLSLLLLLITAAIAAIPVEQQPLPPDKSAKVASPTNTSVFTRHSPENHINFTFSLDPKVLPHEYMVGLHSNHNLEEHYQFLDRNLSVIAEDFHSYEGISAYYLKCDDETLFEILKDPGVKYVDQNRYARPIPCTITCGWPSVQMLR